MRFSIDNFVAQESGAKGRTAKTMSLEDLSQMKLQQSLKILKKQLPKNYSILIQMILENKLQNYKIKMQSIL